MRVRVSSTVLLPLVFFLGCGGRPQQMIEEFGLSEGEDAADQERRAPTTNDAYVAPPPPQQAVFPRADVSVVLPYMGPERTVDVSITASPGTVDVHLAVDTTGSFSGEIDDLKQQLNETVIPGLRSRIQSLSLGISSFKDMPYQPFGGASDAVYQLFVPQTSATAQVTAGVYRLQEVLGGGGDGPEAWIEALYQIATGEGLRSIDRVLVPPFTPRPLPDTGRLGGVGFREGSTRMVLVVSDASSHDGADYRAVVPGAHTAEQALAAMNRLSVRVAGIASGASARPQMESFALATGAIIAPENGRCPTGLNGGFRMPLNSRCPAVWDLNPDGTGLSRTIVEGVARILDAAVYTDAFSEVLDDPNRFVQVVEALRSIPPAGTPAPALADRQPAGRVDGIADTFVDVRARTELVFRLRLQNRMVRPTEFPQSFFARVLLRGDGAPLREVLVRITVPEGPKFDLPVPDATETLDTGSTDVVRSDVSEAEASFVGSEPPMDAEISLPDASVEAAVQPDAAVDAQAEEAEAPPDVVSDGEGDGSN